MIQISETKYFQLFSCCIPVKGAVRSIICDLQRNSFVYISSELCEIFLMGESIEIKKIMTVDSQELNQFLAYLIDEEYGFTCDDPKSFPKINFFNDDYPQILKNVIIDFDDRSLHDLACISNQISSLMCSAIELRYFTEKRLLGLLKDINAFKYSTVRSINLVTKYTNEITLEALNEICVENKRLKQIIVHSGPINHTEQLDLQTIIIFTKEEITDETHCGNISPFYFQSNVDFFKESLVVNNCLDKKIGIDKEGNIKNCPSMKIVYGHIGKDNILDILKNKDFQKVRKIRKDDIEICRDCEFRYICMDCRAYTLDENNVFSKPKKCNYDPYQNKWI